MGKSFFFISKTVKRNVFIAFCISSSCLNRFRWIALGIAGAFCILGGCSTSSNGPESRPLPVAAFRVEPQTLPADFRFVGVGASSHIVQIRARVEGYLESICFKEGGRVEAGDLLFVLDQRPFTASLENARGHLDRQKAILWNAQQAKSRMIPLYKRNAVSQKDLDQAIASELAALAEVEMAEADFYKAQINLDFASISAPVSGLIGEAKFREGALISPGFGDENLLTTLYVVDPIWVHFNISDNDLLKIRKQVSLKTLELPVDGNFQIEAILSDGTIVPASGLIDFSNPAIQQSTGTMLFRSVFSNPNLLIYPGQFVKVVVKGAKRPKAVAVPQEAVMQGANGTFVYVIENGAASLRHVTAGDWYKNYWVIESGLNSGDIVIANGTNRIRPNQSVVIQTLIPSKIE